MANELKQRKKGSPSAKDVKDTQRGAPASGNQAQDEQPRKMVVDTPVSERGSLCPELRTVLCLFCVAVCVALTWLVFQQSHNLTVIEEKYQSLQTRSTALEDLEDKVKLIFGKLASTEDILAEVTSSSSVVSLLQQRVSSLHKNVDNIQGNEQTLSERMRNVNTKFQNITDTWKKSLEEITLHTNSVKSEAKSFHNQITAKINTADQTLKQLSEKLKDLEDSTARNTRTVKRQEEDELVRIKDVLDWDTNAIKELESEQNDLANLHTDITQNLAVFGPKLEECINNLPTIEGAIRTLLKVSNEMLELDKKMNELTVQVFNTEDNLLKTISEILEIQHALEGMQFDNSILKMQNEISLLKEKTHKLPSNKDDDLLLVKENELEPGDGQS
ncbi:inhibitor of nuclear factor kappa-B kinase-interacting protein [Rhinophrynus dorsalis]